MKHALLFVVMSILCGCATHQTFTFEKRKFDHDVLNVIIPHIKVTNLTIEEAVKELEREWQEQMEDKRVPEKVFIRYVTRSRKGQLERRISFEEENIPVEDCLQLITQLGPMESGFQIRNGKLLLTYYHSDLDSDYWTTSLAVSDRAIQLLNITDKITSEELTNSLRSYGIIFGDGASAGWYPRIKRIRVTTYDTEIEKLRGLLLFIDTGCNIQPTEETKQIMDAQRLKILKIEQQQDLTDPFFSTDLTDPFAAPATQTK